MWPVGQAVKTTASHAVNRSSILLRVTTYALLAQLVEQLTLNQRAQGSSPWKCTRYPLSREIWIVDFLYQKTQNILQLNRSDPVML